MDKKAKKILIERHWSSLGWKKKYESTEDDFEYAKSKGLMFDNLKDFDHDKLLFETKQLHEKIPLKKITDGFIISLSNRRLDWRSAIASYVNFELNNNNDRLYKYCEWTKIQISKQDLNVLNFERIKWGGVRHHWLIYNYLDLLLFDREEIPEPTTEEF